MRDGKSALLDRSIDSTLAYQGFGGSVDRDFIRNLNYVANSGRKPDLTFIIDVNPEIGIKNARKSKGRDTSRIDEKDIIYHKKVAEGFKDIAKNNPDRCVIIPYIDGIEKIQEQIRNKFSERYLDRF